MDDDGAELERDPGRNRPILSLEKENALDERPELGDVATLVTVDDEAPNGPFS
jgi:hypothetical protein